jgi:GET complex subunit GET2
MSSAEESPAQLAARRRRERREAKILEGGSARLDKITSLNGRTTASGMIPYASSISISNFRRCCGRFLLSYEC